MTYVNIYAQCSDLVGTGGTGGRYDARIIADLVQDNNARAGDFTNVSLMQTALASNVTINEVLADASGLINSYALQGQRYTVANLQALTDVDVALLVRMTCSLAYGMLILRRGDVKQQDLPPEYLETKEFLQDLREGKEVFNYLPAEEAGIANAFFPSCQQYVNLNLFRDRATPGFYLPRPPQSTF